jgi:hypothetical protein
VPPLATYSLSGDKRSEGKPLKHFEEELGSTCRDGRVAELGLWAAKKIWELSPVLWWTQGYHNPLI